MFLELLASLKEALDSFRNSEAISVPKLAFFLLDDARVCYMSHMNSGGWHGNALKFAWPHFVHELLQHLVTDEVLHTAYYAVSRAIQETKEDELASAQRIQEAAIVYPHVFTPVDMVSCYIRWLHDSVR